MTIPVSTVPRARLAIYTAAAAACTAATGISLLVCYDTPGPNEPDDIVSVGACTERNVSRLAMVGDGAAFALQETYSLEVTVDVFRAGDYAQAAYERAWALLGQLEQALRADPTLGGVVTEAWPKLGRDETSWDSDHKGRRARLSLDVSCYAAI